MLVYVHCNPITHFDAWGLSADDCYKASDQVRTELRTVQEYQDKTAAARQAYETSSSEYDMMYKHMYEDGNQLGFTETDLATKKFEMIGNEKLYKSAQKQEQIARSAYDTSVENYVNVLKENGIDVDMNKPGQEYAVKLGYNFPGLGEPTDYQKKMEDGIFVADNFMVNPTAEATLGRGGAITWKNSGGGSGDGLSGEPTTGYNFGVGVEVGWEMPGNNQTMTIGPLSVMRSVDTWRLTGFSVTIGPKVETGSAAVDDIWPISVSH